MVDGVWVVREIIFDRLSPGKIPLLKFSLSRPKAQIQMRKVDGKSYRIAIAGAQLSGPQLSLPHFPPADFDGFAVVSAKQHEDYVEITIGVEPGTTIGAFVRGDQIWVKRL
jgi:hypothetical protein